jgi:hypothetical protein
MWLALLALIIWKVHVLSALIWKDYNPFILRQISTHIIIWVLYREITTTIHFLALANINHFSRVGTFLWIFMKVQRPLQQVHRRNDFFKGCHSIVFFITEIKMLFCTINWTYLCLDWFYFDFWNNFFPDAYTHTNTHKLGQGTFDCGRVCLCVWCMSLSRHIHGIFFTS